MLFRRPKPTKISGVGKVIVVSVIGLIIILLYSATTYLNAARKVVHSPPTTTEDNPSTIVNLPMDARINPVLKAISKRDILLEKLQKSAKLYGNLNGTRTTVTLVSAFFDLAKAGQKTKHDPDFYLATGKDGLLSMDSPLVFFTDSPEQVLAARMKAAKPNSPTYIISISLAEFEVVQEHLERVSSLIKKDDEANMFGYSGLLYIVYHAKPEMMSLAYLINPFKTEKFLWMDVGCVRNWAGIDAADYIKKPFPRLDRERLLGKDGRILMQGVAGSPGPCAKEIRWVDPENPDAVKDPPTKLDDPLKAPIQPNNWWIAGAIWGGRGQDLIRYEVVYRMHLKRYLEQDIQRYAMIDQYMMGALACHTNMVEVVRPPVLCCQDRTNRKWFFMLLFLKDKEYPQQPYTDEEIKTRPKDQIQACFYCKADNRKQYLSQLSRS